MHPLILPGGEGIPTPALDLNLMPTTLDSRITLTRASGATDALWSDGIGASYNSYLTDAPRNLRGLGLLRESSRVNSLLNSTAPATQTTGSLGTGTYCLWVNGSGSAAVTVGTATITSLTGPASQGVYATFSVTVAGTVTVTVTGSLNWFQLENGNSPSSLIVTAGAAATRANEFARMSTSGWYLEGRPGTLWAECVPLFEVPPSLAGRIADIGKASADTIDRFTLSLRASVQTAQVIVLTNSTSYPVTFAKPYLPRNILRVAGSYSHGTLRGSQVGMAGDVVTAYLGAGQDTLGIGCSAGTTNVNSMFGYVRGIKYWAVALSPEALRKATGT